MSRRKEGRVMGKKKNPGVIIVVSFLCVAIIGILLLSLPCMTTDGQGLGFSDAAFMAVSGSCIIGLSVIDVSTELTFWGQLVLLGLIQTGGVGFMTLATSVFAALGIRMGFSYRNIMKESLNHNTYYDIFSLTLTVVRYTFLIEGIGAVLLALRFVPLFGLTRGLWYSIFHAVSAFNNAGFDLFGNSLESFVGDWYVNAVFMFLIIIGGMGFVVILELITQWRRKEEPFEFVRFSLHTKVVLIITALLLGVGTIAYLVIEFNNPATLGPLPLDEKLLAAMFQSVTSRTAGFSTIVLGNMQDSSILIMMFLMFVGGSPGSTSGGIKTTTFGIVLLAVYAVVRGREELVVLGRRISVPTILKSLAVIVVSMMLILTSLISLSLVENTSLLQLAFEVISAFSTTGASIGATTQLSIIGKFILMLTMFLGRIGPLTIMLALTVKSKKSKLQYPEGQIMIG